MDLNDAYANAPYIEGAAQYPGAWEQTANAYRKQLSFAGRIRPGLMYGHGTREVLDLFLPEGTPKGLFVFVHGGYWKSFDRSSWSHLAEGMRANGWAVAMPSYDLCPRVRIADITRQVAQAVSVAAQEIGGPVRLAGHSAGGHLVARMCAPGVLPDAVRARLAHVMPISPLGDLRPLMQTLMNQELQIDEVEAQSESPIFQPKPETRVTVWVGGDERPAFIQQAQDLAQAWTCDLQIEPGKHHFDVVDCLEQPNSALVQRLLLD